jgi:solute carrier family 8 (sodium/calcium exchanger)
MSFTGWRSNLTHLCYWSDAIPPGGDGQWCGAKDVCSQVGMLFPLFFEQTWPLWVRIVLYTIGLLYSFIAVFIVADIFMCSIDSISSTTKKVTVTDPDGKEKTVEVPMWNGSVANIILMSLGPRTAPEIALSIAGIVTTGFKSDPMGSSLIIGSGAFNLLVISAVSIFVIPDGESRRIKTYSVFVVTMFWSIFAYVWMLVILKWSSADMVEIWEAATTVAFIPVIAISCWIAEKCSEKGCFDWVAYSFMQIILCQPEFCRARGRDDATLRRSSSNIKSAV